MTVCYIVFLLVSYFFILLFEHKNLNALLFCICNMILQFLFHRFFTLFVHFISFFRQKLGSQDIYLFVYHIVNIALYYFNVYVRKELHTAKFSCSVGWRPECQVYVLRQWEKWFPWSDNAKWLFLRVSY